MRKSKVILSGAGEISFQVGRRYYMIKDNFLLPGEFMMKHRLLFTIALVLLTQNLFAQTPSPTPTPAADDDVVKISTSLIQVDVTVTDSKGRIITDLKPGEIEVYENGEKQKISNFSFVSNISTETQTDAPKVKIDKNAIAPPPVAVKPEQVRRTIALVVDDLTLSFESVHYVRDALKKFVDEQMQTGDLVAIIRTGAGVGALQQFTTDKRQLYAAIEKVRWNPAGSGKIGAFAPIEATPLEKLKAAGGNITDEQLEEEKNRIQSGNDLRSDIFATGTLGAVNFIVKGMKELPGRKSVMLLSDGFKLFTKDESGFTDASRVLDSIKSLADLANRSSVVIYTMDARGLQVLGLTAADDTSEIGSDKIEEKLDDRRAENFDTQDGLRYLAKQTGGFAIINSNDLSGGIRKVLNDQSYYLLGYEPNADTFDPVKRKFNKLTVKVLRSGAKVRYRSGFFGISDEKTANQTAVVLTPGQRINSALTSPFAVNDIDLRLNTLFGNDIKQGAFVTSLLHVDARSLQFSDEADGTKKAVFDIVAMSFGDNGIVADRISKTYTLTVPKTGNFQNLIDKGFVYTFTFPVKKAGAYQYRVAVLDTRNNKIGSANQFIEVPNLKKGNLTLSGIVLENLTVAQWNAATKNIALPEGGLETSPLDDTSVRSFKRGTILRYGFEIYNAKLDAAQKADLTLQLRVFQDGKMILDGTPKPIQAAAQPDLKSIKANGAINLGTEMTAGDYVMQIVVTDNTVKSKKRTTTQFVQFEITD